MNDVARVKEILRTEPGAGARKTVDRWPAMHQAVALDRQEIVKLFLDSGCDPNLPNDPLDPLGPGPIVALPRSLMLKPTLVTRYRSF